MRVLLDENFPVGLVHELRGRSVECDHIIDLGMRGTTDAAIVALLDRDPGLVLLTQDADFEDVEVRGGGVLISRVPQSLPIRQRIAIWAAAVERFVNEGDPARVVEITAAGELRALGEPGR